MCFSDKNIMWLKFQRCFPSVLSSSWNERGIYIFFSHPKLNTNIKERISLKHHVEVTNHNLRRLYKKKLFLVKMAIQILMKSYSLRVLLYLVEEKKLQSPSPTHISGNLYTSNFFQIQLIRHSLKLSHRTISKCSICFAPKIRFSLLYLLKRNCLLVL